jgi:hypothetical protein
MIIVYIIHRILIKSKPGPISSSVVFKGLCQIENNHILPDHDEHSIGAYNHEGSVGSKKDQGTKKELHSVQQAKAS